MSRGRRPDRSRSGCSVAAATAPFLERTVVLVLALLAFMIVLAARPESARSAGAYSLGFGAIYDAGPGEDNNVLIEVVPDSNNDFSGTDEVFQITDSAPIQDLDGPQPDGCIVFSVLAKCAASPGTVLFVYGRDRDDHVKVVTSRPVNVCGGSGNDSLIGGPGGDRIAGGPGSDDIKGNEGADAIYGTSGDALLGCPADGGPETAGGDRLEGGDGRDAVQGSPRSDLLLGGPDGDRLFGLDGDDSLDGGSGDDTIVGRDGDDSLQGGSGTDELSGGPGSDSEFGGEGDDELGTSWTFVRGVIERDNGDDTMDGGPGEDVLNGGPGQLLGIDSPTSLKDIDEGPEVAEANGSDSMHGGEGRDTVTYVKRATAVALSLDGEQNDGASGELDRIGTDVERVVGGSGDDAITGTPANDDLDGGKGSDSIEGGPGDDLLSGGRGDEGRDSVRGGEGEDTLSGFNGGDLLFGGPGRDSMSGGGGSDSLEGATGDDVMTGGPGGDLVIGGSGDDNIDGADPLFSGADGRDDLRGEAGKDSLVGGEGDDLLAGGSGPDLLRGGGGNDTADYSAAATPVTITLDGKANDGGEGERDNFSADVEGARGGGEEDLLSGDARANELSGGGGEDFLDGGKGPDRLNGNDGNDAIESRDATRDLVSCGRGFDVAIADRLDLVRDNCELVDRDPGRSAALARLLSIRLVRGSVRLRPRSMDRFFPFKGQTEVPVRSAVDARKGTVELSVRVAHGRRRSSAVRGGAFMADQSRSRSPLTELRLRGGHLERCGRNDGDPTGRARHQSRTLWVRAGGRLRVIGRHGHALGRGAIWTTTDRCDGTIVRVQRGRVMVFDRPRGRSFKLTAGEAHLARR